MSLASYQLLHSAIFLICGCKGNKIFPFGKILAYLFLFFDKNSIILAEKLAKSN